jgi:hypothetical protein
MENYQLYFSTRQKNMVKNGILFVKWPRVFQSCTPFHSGEWQTTNDKRPTTNNDNRVLSLSCERLNYSTQQWQQHCTKTGKGRQKSLALIMLKATIKQFPFSGNDDPTIERCKFSRICLIVVWVCQHHRRTTEEHYRKTSSKTVEIPAQAIFVIQWSLRSSTLLFCARRQSSALSVVTVGCRWSFCHLLDNHNDKQHNFNECHRDNIVIHGNFAFPSVSHVPCANFLSVIVMVVSAWRRKSKRSNETNSRVRRAKAVVLQIESCNFRSLVRTGSLRCKTWTTIASCPKMENYF